MPEVVVACGYGVLTQVARARLDITKAFTNTPLLDAPEGAGMSTNMEIKFSVCHSGRVRSFMVVITSSLSVTSDLSGTINTRLVAFFPSSFVLITGSFIVP